MLFWRHGLPQRMLLSWNLNQDSNREICSKPIKCKTFKIFFTEDKNFILIFAEHLLTMNWLCGQICTRTDTHNGSFSGSKHKNEYLTSTFLPIKFICLFLQITSNRAILCPIHKQHGIFFFINMRLLQEFLREIWSSIIGFRNHDGNDNCLSTA